MSNAFRLSAAALACMLLYSLPLHAQTKEPEVPAQPEAPKLDPKACTDRDRLTSGDTVETEGQASSQEDTTDKLARTGGVICPPPGLDPQIRAPAPNTQSDMPVIRPPANPGDAPQAPK
jgi:hypothetical protein